MKKNKMMRLASFLLVAVLLSTCAISGTFAKYVTTVSNTDTARVARWGFTGENAEIAITDLFKTGYDNANVNGYTDVIAPGTTNQATFVFEYTAGTPDAVAAPEVAYSLVVSTDGSTCADAIKNNANIKWAVLKTSELEGGNTVPVAEWKTWDEMITEIEGLDGDESFDAKELAPISNTSYTIAWKWDFSTDAAGDAADTAMGNVGDLADVKIVITITATQVD